MTISRKPAGVGVAFQPWTRVGLGERWRREQGECGEFNEVPDIIFAVDKQAGFHR